MRLRMTHRLFCALLWLLPLPVAAQVVTVPVQQLPVTLTVTWDDDVSAAPPSSYEVSLDGGVPVRVPAVAVPCVACAEVPVTILTVGLHTIAVRGANAAGLSDPATLDVTLTFLVLVPNPPTKLRLSQAGPLPSPAGTLVPPSLSLTAADLSVWSLSAPLVDAATVCPGALAIQCRSVIINGRVVDGANAYELLMASDGAIWMHTWGGLWYRAGSSVGQAARPQ